MPNLKLDFSRYICANQSLVRKPPLGGDNYFDKLLRLEIVKLLSRQYKILDITILTLYRKLYINIVSIIVLGIEIRQYNIKINPNISCSPRTEFFFYYYLFKHRN